MVAFFREAHAQTGAGYKLRTLNPHQNATVVVLTDLIIPETDTPGAKAALVNEFIDVILTEWANDAERQNFLQGLAGIDKQSQELFGKDFVDATPQQQVTLLRAMDDYATTERGEYHQKHGNTVPELTRTSRGTSTIFSVASPCTATTPQRSDSPRNWDCKSFPARSTDARSWALGSATRRTQGATRIWQQRTPMTRLSSGLELPAAGRRKNSPKKE